jgi:hypothetical protein
MSKWMKVDPATLKVGDEVRWVVEITGGRVIREVVVSEVCPRSIRLGLTYIAPGNGTWYIRKPKKAKPLTRPDEPPVGSFFRVGGALSAAYRRHDKTINGYFCITSPTGWRNWHEITEPGDTITMLELLEVGK